MNDNNLNIFFQELELKNNVDNFINHNKKPTFSKNTEKYNIRLSKQMYPLMDEPIYNLAPIFDKIYMDEETDNIKKSIDACDKVIMVLTDNPPEVEMCPVCMTEFEDSNYVIPKCKHKVCAICFTNNIKYNKHTGDCCVLCRKRIC